MAMHEVSVMQSVIAMVQQEQTRHAFARVTMIRLSLGALGAAEPQALRFCFDAVTAGTIAEGARLEIEIIPGAGWCADCRCSVTLDERFGACPVCAGGHVLRLAEMEVE
jgi:hydrogenase nickel incorporation protein HypA/HybF